MIELRIADVGVGRFNRDHQRLLFYIDEFNRLSERFSRRAPYEDEWDQVDALFPRLEKYTRTHFQAEEDLMLAHDYPGFKDHKRQHEQLIQSLSKLKTHVEQRESNYVADLKGFLFDWLKNHINGHDLKYRDFFLERGVE